jgi:hypothetical protein
LKKKIKMVQDEFQCGREVSHQFIAVAVASEVPDGPACLARREAPFSMPANAECFAR